MKPNTTRNEFDTISYIPPLIMNFRAALRVGKIWPGMIINILFLPKISLFYYKKISSFSHRFSSSHARYETVSYYLLDFCDVLRPAGSIASPSMQPVSLLNTSRHTKTVSFRPRPRFNCILLWYAWKHGLWIMRRLTHIQTLRVVHQLSVGYGWGDLYDYTNGAFESFKIFFK